MKPYPIIWIFPLLLGCKKEPIGPQKLLLWSFENIELEPIAERRVQTDWEKSGWGIYEDIIFPGDEIEWNVSHDQLESVPVLNCQITGGDAYNNVFFTNTIASKSEGSEWYFQEANYFEFEIEFYPATFIDCDNSDRSQIEGMEFTFQHVIIPDSWGWGIQWSKTNTWSYWDDQKIDSKPRGWVNMPTLDGCLSWNTWNRLSLSGKQSGNQLIYQRLSVNEQTIDLNIQLPSVTVPDGWAENFIQVGFQINGNKALLTDHQQGVDPVTIFLKNVNLKVYED